MNDKNNQDEDASQNNFWDNDDSIWDHCTELENRTYDFVYLWVMHP